MSDHQTKPTIWKLLGRSLFVITLLFSISLNIVLCFNRAAHADHATKKTQATESQSIEYREFISILLTTLGVMFAGGSIVVGVAALWGYESIKKNAGDVAASVAEDTARKLTPGVARKIARRVARKQATEIASTVALRVARNTRRAQISRRDANKIAKSYGGEE